MEIVKNFLISHSSASLTLMSNRLEIPYKKLYPILESALQELGIHNYRLIYSIASGFQIIICTEKNKKELEEKYALKAKIYAVQRITEDINNLYNSELQERDFSITEESKNGSIFIPIYSNTGGYPQSRREYSNQKKLNFKVQKKFDKCEREIKEVQDVVADTQKHQEFELEEEEIVRYPANQQVSFNKITELQIDDMADIIFDEEDVAIVKEVKSNKRNRKIVESDEGDSEKEVKKRIERIPEIPKRKNYVPEPMPRKRIHESIIPTGGPNKNCKLSQPSLAAFMKK